VPANKKRKKAAKRRSQCPLNIALELIGDSWSLLIMRDILFKGFSTFKDFRTSNEGVATNILADRLKKMTADGFIIAVRSTDDRRVMNYQPTRKGLDLAPMMVAMMLWVDKYESHSVPPKKIAKLAKGGDKYFHELMTRFGMT
jgi:DNA-binding HxlR family transcriptional regulator